MKIILINSTPMDDAFRLWKIGEYPGHHLWGTLEIANQSGIECFILKHEKYRFLNRLGRLMNLQFLDQQIRTLWLLRKYDMIYAPYAAANTKLLVILKLLKIVKKPIVIVVHQPLFGGMSTENFLKKYILKRLVSQYNALIFLSEKLKQDLIKSFQIPEKIYSHKFFNLEWGPDIAFYEKFSIPLDPSETSFAISAGHTDRDFDTLIEAFRYINFPLKIYCTQSSLPKTTKIPSNVTIIAGHSYTSYNDLLNEYNNARVVIIPLTENPPGTQGLTSLLDVLAMGKPVIMTQNLNVNLDVEKEGIGITVKEGDVQSMINASNLILFDFCRLKSMSIRAKELARSKFNMNLYSKGLEKIFLEIYKEYKA